MVAFIDLWIKTLSTAQPLVSKLILFFRQINQQPFEDAAMAESSI